MLEYLLGVVIETFAAFLQAVLGVGLRRCAEQIASAELTEPAAETVEILFFLVEFGGGELLDADLLGDLALELGALGEKLHPFGFALVGVARLEFGDHGVAARDGIEDQHITVGALDQLDRTRDSLHELGPARHRPSRLLQRHRADAAQFAPDRDPVPGGLGREVIRHHHPLHKRHRSARYSCSCNVSYANTSCVVAGCVAGSRNAARKNRAEQDSGGAEMTGPRLGLVFYVDPGFVDNIASASLELRELELARWIMLQPTDILDTELAPTAANAPGFEPCSATKSAHVYSQVLALLVHETDDTASPTAVRDAMPVATTVCSGGLYFITSDQAILEKRVELFAAFNLYTMTPERALAFAKRVKARYEHRESQPL